MKTMDMNFLRLCLLAWILIRNVALGSSDETFLIENRAQEGVVELPSGLQYKVLVEGEGTFHPQPLCQCLVHYEGRLLNGHVFDSSFDRGEPLRVSPSQVIDGWAEAMHLMVQHDKWELYVPPALGYGERGHPPDIPGNAALVFTMEMIALDCDQKVPALKCNVETKQGCSAREIQYLEKISPWTGAKVTTELERLQKLLADDGPLREDLKEWIIRREFILMHQTGSVEDEL